MDNKKQIATFGIAIGVTILLVAGLSAGLRLLQQRQQPKPKAFFGRVNATILPTTKTIPVGEKFDVHLNLDSGQHRVSGVNFALRFDKQRLKVVEVKGARIFNQKFLEKADNQKGVITLALFVARKTSELPKGNFEAATITFQAKEVGEARIWLDTSRYEIVGYNPAGRKDLSLKLSNAPEVRYKIISAPANTPELSFKIRFGGVEEKISDQRVKVKVRRGDFVKEFAGVVVNFDEEGVGTGRVTLTGVEPGEGYAIFVKGPKHLGRKFCQLVQTERCHQPGGEISLAAGDNQADWTGLPLEPGDVPDEEGKQDGVVDGTDFARVKSQLGKEGDDLSGDLDFNGVVNGRDLVLLLNTLSSKFEEEY